MQHIFTNIFQIVIILSFSVSAQTSPPEWSYNAIWYQIFPERFNNGDTTNDPAKDDIINIWPYIEPENWSIHPWTSDWYFLQPWEKSLNLSFYQIHGLRRYGGDLQGIIDKLDYLKELGINAIYLNPIFESPSHHKYDAAMYHHIDNNFGPDPERDKMIWQSESPNDPTSWKWTSADSLFLQLIKECHHRNIRIIIDGVFNHVGIKFWAFLDVKEDGINSVYKDWFTIKMFDDPETPEDEFDYEGWYGIKDLPEIREDDNGLIDEFKQHIKAIVKRWMDPNDDGDPSDGIDGWRLDVAEMVNIKFWEEFRGWVKQINPEAYLTGEVWWEDWQNNKMFNAAPWLNHAFDGVMNYRFARAVKLYVISRARKINTRQFIDSLNNIYSDYKWQSVLAIQNLLDSHDVDRITSQIMNPDLDYDHRVNAADNIDYVVSAPDSIAMQKIKLIVALQMTLPGAPMIYYGDEAGMWGGDDPDCRKPMVWSEFNYDDEIHHPFNQQRTEDRVKFNSDLFNWYKKLIAIRKQNNVFNFGKIEFYEVSPGILMYKRYDKEDNCRIVIANNQPDKAQVIVTNYLNYKPSQPVFDLVSESKLIIDKSGIISLQPYQTVILE